MHRKRLIVGVDIGGTFTDIVILELGSGVLQTWKVLTTPNAPEEAVLRGVEEALMTYDHLPTQIVALVHATTLVTNAIIERKGAVTGLITTHGFKDAIEIGREMRYDLYDLDLRFPAPLVERSARKEITARSAPDGSVVAAVELSQLRAAMQTLAHQGIASVAVCLINSYADPSLEEQVAIWLDNEFPGLSVSISSDVAREIGEYERTSTVTANAYVKPVVDRYIILLEQGLALAGVHAPLLIMHSAGGFCAPSIARRFPIRLLESGPAAGALAAAHAGASANISELVGFDMGGTTAKACLIQDGVTEITFKFEAGRVHRFKRGSGLPILNSSVDLIEIGAGGGSIARVDSLGLIQVGPESSSSDPGPACYGLGGTAPTVTDADLVLGYLDPNSFLGGRMHLSSNLANESIDHALAEPLGLTRTQAAWGIHQVVNENMAGAARIYLAEKGRDPRRLSLVATGGAGPVHAFGVARSLGCHSVIYPYAAGVGSAVGLLVAPPREDEVQPFLRPLNSQTISELPRMLQELEARALERFQANSLGLAYDSPTNRASSNVTGEPDSAPSVGSVFTRFSGDLRYVGQGQWVNIPLNPTAPDANAIISDFHQQYLNLFGNSISGVELEFVNLRVVITTIAADPRLRHQTQEPGTSRISERSIFLPSQVGGAVRVVPVYRRSSLRTGAKLFGPCVIEEDATTIIVNGDTAIHVDNELNVVVKVPYHNRGHSESHDPRHDSSLASGPSA